MDFGTMERRCAISRPGNYLSISTMATSLVGTLPSTGFPAYTFSRWTALLLGFGFGVYAYTLFDKMLGWGVTDFYL